VKLVAILRRELAALLGAPLGWAVTTVFLVLSGYFFYTNLSFFVLMGGFDLNRGLWQYQFQDMRLVLLLVAPLITMRSFAEERRQGTLELLWAYPVRDESLVAGKYAAVWIVVALMLASTLTYPVVLARIYPIDWPSVLAGYAGLLLLAAAFLACGLFVSSLVESQLVAAAVTVGILLLFWTLTWNEAAASEAVLSWLAPLSLFDRFHSFARGAVDSKDVVFFVLFAGFFLFLTLLSLESRSWRGLR
jgi:ABC-2 type transport system permease protein